ncbi:C-type lectin receptor-like tyrosine-protein kinase [Vitis vinifera]|uniref:C-type lectin receptor-like tyrosine-protein kinase n=1 Tax=Vitis vinifera TaxID=29760 RepID=A0A438CTL7_VITVI|nr:C-type lectin receptor-like tyrosine-protein kinase [Vitis vinifera]
MEGKLVRLQFPLLVISCLVFQLRASDAILHESRRSLESRKEAAKVDPTTWKAIIRLCLQHRILVWKQIEGIPSYELALQEESQGTKWSAIQIPTAGALCPPDWITGPDKNKCFRYIGNPQSWDVSEAYCKSLGGHLAALTSFQELSSVQNLCGESNNGCWVGGRGVNSTFGAGWKWSDNTSHWNESIFPNCTNSSCHIKNSVDSCTLVTNGSTFLIGERCNMSHASICMIDIENKCYHMHCHKEYLIILAVVSGLILSTTLAVVIWLLAYRRSKRRRRSRKLSNPAASALVPPSWKVFTNEELRSITKNFSEGNRLLGDAKTGGTYSGLLPDGSRVAVKRLKRSTFQRKKEFYSEIGRVARLHHPNLVAVKGCCYDHGDRYIVYEFIINGPLDRWLHHIPRGGRSLDWAMRMKIATTLAQGIAYV